MLRYEAYYEDWKRAKALAIKKGWKDDEDIDWYVDPHVICTMRIFETQDAAVAWLKSAVKTKKTTYGAGTIHVMESVARRCKYCVCDGWQTTKHIWVSQDGIDGEDSDISSSCYDDDD